MSSTTEIPLEPIVTTQPLSDDFSLDAETNGIPRLSGLGPLEATNQLKIKQKIRMSDICGTFCGCEAKKKYDVQGSEGENLYLAKESSKCCNRFWFANIRPLHLSIEDQTGREVIKFIRPLNCSGWCCSCCYPRCTQRLEVVVHGEPVGFMRERPSWCYPVLHLFNSDGVQMMKIRGPLFQYCTCDDVVFSVTDISSGNEVATITKKWMGFCYEATLDADNFIIDFLTEISVKDKAVILAAAFLLDFMYYEGD